MWVIGLLACNYIPAARLDEQLDRDRDGVDDLEDCDRDDVTVGLPRVWYVDADGDGFGVADGRATPACEAPTATTSRAGDCDDTDPAVNPDAAEVCGGLDDDCDGRIDDDDDDVGGQPTWFVDHDGDGVPGSVAQLACEPSPTLLPTPQAFDCDDADPARTPGRPEQCGNGIDDDCDTRVDDAGLSALPRWPDLDGDGFTGAESSPRCAANEPGWLTIPTPSADCDDARADVFPGTPDLPDDGIDQDCSGTDRRSCYVDADEDGFTDGATALLDVASCPPVVLGDCDDGDALVSPEAVEICANDRDDDCDGATDDVGLDPVERWPDADLDGAALDTSTLRCVANAAGWLDAPPDVPDCDDEDGGRAPGLLEVPDDGVDQDCTGLDLLTCPVDADGDGHAGALVEVAEAAGCPDVLGTGDCDDDDPLVVPDRELFLDADLDGVPGTTSALRCAGIDELDWRPEPPAFDCDDGAPDLFPGATETADDGIDQDCNGVDATVCPLDADGDGYGVPGAEVALDGVCGVTISAEEDCDDGDPRIHPGAVEVCDTIDHDCDGLLANGPRATRWTGATPGALPSLAGVTVASGQVVRICGGGLWDGPITVEAGGVLESVDGEPSPRIRAPVGQAGITVAGRAEGLTLVGLAGAGEVARVGGGLLVDSEVLATGRPTGVRFDGPGALEGVSVTGASGVGVQGGDLVTAIPGEVRASGLTVTGNGRSIDLFAQRTVLAEVEVGPHALGARIRGGSLDLVDGVFDHGGTPGPGPVLELLGSTSVLERVEVAGGASVGIRVQGDSEMLDVVSRDHGGTALVLVGGDHLLEDVALRDSGAGLQTSAGLLVGRQLLVSGNASNAVVQTAGFQILDDASIVDNGGLGLRVDGTALSFMEGGSIERNQGSNAGGVQVSGVARLTGVAVRDNQANEAGGLRVDAGGELRLFDCEIAGNTAAYGGAGLRVDGEALVTVSGGAFLDHVGPAGAVMVTGNRGSVQYAAAGTEFSGNDRDLVFASGFEYCDQDPYSYTPSCYGASALYGSGIDADAFTVVVDGHECTYDGPISASCQCESQVDPYNTSTTATYCLCYTSLGTCGGPGACAFEGGDGDSDGYCDYYDTCSGPGQFDDDYDGLCDDTSCPAAGCDPCPGENPNQCEAMCAYDPTDTDGDGACDARDPCPTDYGTSDDDGDALCEGDPCPGDASNTCTPPCSTDSDGDGTCDEQDPCPYDFGTSDEDGDGMCDGDPCPYDPSNTCIPWCSTDSDGDGTCDDEDPCPNDPDPGCGVDTDPP